METHHNQGGYAGKFCFLLQVTSRLFDHVMNDAIDNQESNNKRPQSQTVTATMSIGLISKKFWSKLSQFQYSYKNLLQKLRENNQSLMDLEQAISDLRLENQKLHRQKRQNAPKLAIKFDGPKLELATPLDNDTLSSSDDNVNKTSISTQTFETAFVECMTCDVLQNYLLDIGSCVVCICENQNLPSAINKHNKILRNTKLSPSNVNKWSSELQKDLKRLESLVNEKEEESRKHENENLDLHAKIGHLEKVIHSLESEKSKFDSIKTELEVKCDFHSKQNEDFQARVKELEKDLYRKEESLNKRNDHVAQLEEQLKNLTEEITKLQSSKQILEKSLSNLSTQLESTKGLQEKNKDFNEELQNYKEKFESLQKDFQSTMDELTELKSENKMLLKHDKTLQTKQSSLLTRIENLDEQCDSLQAQLNDVTDEKEEVVKENEEFRKKIVQLEDKQSRNDIVIKHANSVRSNDETSLENFQQEIEHLEEVVNLLVCYPVMSNDYQNAEKRYTEVINNRRFQGSHGNSEGDIVYDMEHQLKANTTRIAILEKQNHSLRNTLVKLDTDHDEKQKSQEVEYHNNTSPTKSERNAKSAPHRTTSNANNTEFEPRPPSPSKTRQNVRPRSAGRRSKDDIQSRLASLEKLKNAVKQPVTEKNRNNNWVSGDSSHDDKMLEKETSFTCPDCDREHVSKRDLDIHKPFCFNRQ
ncbi:coiled-coil domain-containing protein 157-like [Clytia hemisphaerica]|uniref:coiled-coil domain-containing protein 157-like n=1 Tax=Clytia hemisphaerica TaxID=252671 RepID=UPI0034D755A7